MSGGVINGTFVHSIEKQFRIVFENAYANMLADRNTWWNKLVKVTDIESLSLRYLWLLTTAGMNQVTANDGGEAGGNIDFDEEALVNIEYFPAMHRRGFKIGKLRYLNSLAGGSDPIAKWVGDEGAYCAYYPQKLTAISILNGASVNSFDNVAFFSGSHPNHALQGASSGTYSNNFTSGSGPGACPIDDSVDIDTALTNFSKAMSYIRSSVLQANGEDPRMLRPLFVLHPPRMSARVHQMFNMTFGPKLAPGGSAAGSADGIQNIFSFWGLGQPVEAMELGSGHTYNFVGPTGLNSTVTGSDTTYYIVCEEANESQLGAFHMVRRLPFTFHTYSGEGGAEGIDAVLGRSQNLEYHVDGALSVNPALPYTIFRCLGS